jgi:pilus assembly protein CpaF
VDLLAALNTGHAGGCGTVHANSAGDVVPRLEGLALATGMPWAAVHSQMGAALEAVVHCVRDRDGRRRVAEVAVLRPGADGRVAVLPAVTFDAWGAVVEHPAAEQLARRLDR